MKGVHFNPATDIHSLQGTTILVTGGNSGLGKHSILEFAKHGPAEIWLGARSTNKAQEAINDIKKRVPNAPPIKILKMDLSSLESIREAATSFLQQAQRLDVLLLNAGLMTVDHGLTQDGYEVQFGTNHVGHALFVKLVLATLLNTAEQPGTDVRVVLLSSSVHSNSTKEGIDFTILKTKAEKIAATTLYGQSKLANILYGQELAKRYPQLKIASVHPGIVSTNLTTAMKETSFTMRVISTAFVAALGQPVEKGALNQLWASTSADVRSGEYYEPVGVNGKGSKWTKSPELAKKLWNWTEEELE
ncbi:hypothetical protein C7974DRAFT_400102 [Boeremia exigua]|uniref:uncharacterized protein n=1 Tax=Boeremia exigua TaxID=749465 RepID=UPI001E8E7E0D|nr:uncharacterized protein C7974DRAFT_400102 [Boeremia exigua]KAH6618444.1 hypothetical protein C7974DRAFT_400102 [Boeremia exigua]